MRGNPGGGSYRLQFFRGKSGVRPCQNTFRMSYARHRDSGYLSGPDGLKVVGTLNAAEEAQQAADRALCGQKGRWRLSSEQFQRKLQQAESLTLITYVDVVGRSVEVLVDHSKVFPVWHAETHQAHAQAAISSQEHFLLGEHQWATGSTRTQQDRQTCKRVRVPRGAASATEKLGELPAGAGAWPGADDKTDSHWIVE